MAEDEPKQAEDQDETPSIVIPSRTPLPPPPDVPYSRPTLSRTGTIRPSSGSDGEPRDVPSEVAGHGAGMAAGITFVTSIVAGALLGNWIDGRWNHTGMPWATMVMTLIGAAAGFINMMRLLNRTGPKKK